MDLFIRYACLALLAALLIVAMIGDLRRFTIPNGLNGAIALLVLPFWWASGLSPWPDIALQLGLALLTLGLFAGLFAIGMMGGGDVKLLAALALWLPPLPFLQMLVLMSLAGGVLTLALLARHRLLRREGRPEIPYGVAIGIAALWVSGQPIVNHFTA